MEGTLPDPKRTKVVARDNGTNFIVDCPLCGGTHSHPRQKGFVKTPCGAGKIMNSGYHIMSSYKSKK